MSKAIHNGLIQAESARVAMNAVAEAFPEPMVCWYSDGCPARSYPCQECRDKLREAQMAIPRGWGHGQYVTYPDGRRKAVHLDRVRAQLAFPNKPCIDNAERVFDDHAAAVKSCILLSPGCPWWVGPAMSAAVVLMVVFMFKGVAW